MKTKITENNGTFLPIKKSNNWKALSMRRIKLKRENPARNGVAACCTKYKLRLEVLLDF
jgi:hypothetical protein